MRWRGFGWMVGLIALAFAAGCGETCESKCLSADGDAEIETPGETPESEEEPDGPPVEPMATAPESWNPDPARTPLYVHLTYQRDNDTAVTFQWQTEEKTEKGYQPKVWLVPADRVPDADPDRFDDDLAMPFDPSLTGVGSGEPYCQDFVCSPKTMTGLQWSVEMTGLQPDQLYYYRVGSWSRYDEATRTFTQADLSPVYRFRTGRPKGSREPFSFGFGSDSQNWYVNVADSMRTIRDTTGREAIFWLFGGDLTEVGTQEWLWAWFDALAPLLHALPSMPTEGNHDIYAAMLYGNFLLPKMPGLPEGYEEYAYSFNCGNAHFVSLNTNGETLIDLQLPWLESDLEAASTDPEIDWIIAYSHHPAYSSSTAHGSTEVMLAKVTPLYDRFGVDLVFSGHDHDYERTKPMKDQKVVDPSEGTVYVVSGGFYSQKYYGNGTSDFTAISVDGAVKSYVVVEIDGTTLRGTAYSGGHEIIDTFELTR